jgi:hypothetical protein
MSSGINGPRRAGTWCRRRPAGQFAGGGPRWHYGEHLHGHASSARARAVDIVHDIGTRAHRPGAGGEHGRADRRCCPPPAAPCAGWRARVRAATWSRSALAGVEQDPARDQPVLRFTAASRSRADARPSSATRCWPRPPTGGSRTPPRSQLPATEAIIKGRGPGTNAAMPGRRDGPAGTVGPRRRRGRRRRARRERRTHERLPLSPP